MTVRSIEKELLKLDVQDRAKLAGILLSSLEDLSEHETEQLWVKESLRRHNDVLKGKAIVQPADGVLKAARSRLR